MHREILALTRVYTACNGTIVNDTEMGEVIQLQGDQRKDVQEFLVDKKEGLELDAKTIKVFFPTCSGTSTVKLTHCAGSWVLDPTSNASVGIPLQWTDRSSFSKPRSLTPCLLYWCGLCQAKACVRALVDTLRVHRWYTLVRLFCLRKESVRNGSCYAMAQQGLAFFSMA